MAIELIKRKSPSKVISIFSPFVALAITLLAGALIFLILGKNPINGLYSFFIEPLTETWSVHELIIKAVPLVLIAIGLSVCFRSSNWNIGAEGQFIIGAMAGSMLPIMMHTFQSPIVLPLMLIMGFVGGALFGLIPAYLKNKFGTNEILTSLMLVYVAQLFLDWMVRGLWKNPEGYNFPESRSFHEFAVLPEMLTSGRANWGAVIAVVVVVIFAVMLGKTLKGFEIKVIGESERAGKFAGFSAKKMTLFAFIISGGLAGLAGIIEVAGAIQQLRPVISPGYGFTAIIVAFLGRLNPWGILAAGLVLALTYLGGEAAQISLGISDKVVRVFQGLLLFFVLLSDTFINYQVRFYNPWKSKLDHGKVAATKATSSQGAK